MALEVTRLLFGLLLLAFHRQVADFVLEQDRLLIVMFRRRGLTLPSALSTETARNVYFGLGLLVVAIEALRIWTLLNP